MTAPGQNVSDAKVKNVRFVKVNLATYRGLANSSQMWDQIRAYRALGRALHPIMDSTSPAHSGWQTWYNPRSAMELR